MKLTQKLPEEAVERLFGATQRTLAAWRGLPGDDAPTVGPREAPVHDVLRDDEPAPGLTQADALRAAPDPADGTFRVPRVADVG